MSKLISLAAAEPGKLYMIARLACTNPRELLAMGLRPGVTVTILQKNNHGAVMIALRDQRFCINHALAQHILLAAVTGEVDLRTAPIGARLRISGYAPTAPSYKRKLLAMGLTPGTELEIIRHAPLGDPTEIKVRGFHLSLRKEEADALEVSPL
ncbi:FeoA family protein [Thermosynechococcus vestitus]|nr:ferrous iron transport protein A [Thermosynechococcus vestitus]BAY50767.1 ferrous iron transport protein A [Thermostichus vulcanus NIES-2134]